MTTGAPGAVFFLGSRAHYQVLQQPESQFDAENGNTETIYQNPSTWKSNGLDPRECYGRYAGRGHATGLGDYHNGSGPFSDRAGYSVLNDINGTDEKDKDTAAKKRNKRRPSETTLCGEDMKPSQLNHVTDDNASPKAKSSRRSLLSFLSSLARRKKRLGSDLQYLQHVEKVLTVCTYRESCRCLECQSSYFDCDEDEEDFYESDDDSEYTMYVTQMQTSREDPPTPEEEEDDEVFVDEVPSDNTSTDMLLEPKKMSVSSESSEDPETMNLEVAAGTPLLLNFLLTHPITCSIQ